MDRMSSNSSSSTVTSSAATSSVFSTLAANWPIVLAGAVTSAFFITSFVLTSQFVGSSDRWEEIKREIMSKVWPLTIVGTIGLFITCSIYILQDPKKSMYFLLVLGCISIGMAYSSLVISIISKQ